MAFLDSLNSSAEGLIAVFGTYQSLDYAVNGSGQQVQQAAAPAPVLVDDNASLYVGIVGMIAAALLLKLVLK